MVRSTQISPFRVFYCFFLIDAPDSRIHGLADHRYGNEGALMDLSLSHIVRIVVCNISTRALFSFHIVGPEN